VGIGIKPLHSFRLHEGKIGKLQKSVSRKLQAAKMLIASPAPTMPRPDGNL
jgi:hypothetical protein